jgi:hypothetical protein
MYAVEKATRALERSLPVAPPPLPDYRAVVADLTETLASFRTLPFADQRSVLKRVVRSLPVFDDSLTAVTVSAAYLGQLHTNSAQPSTT